MPAARHSQHNNLPNPSHSDGGIVIGTRPRDAAHAAELEKDFGSYGGSNVRR